MKVCYQLVGEMEVGKDLMRALAGAWSRFRKSHRSFSSRLVLHIESSYLRDRKDPQLVFPDTHSSRTSFHSSLQTATRHLSSPPGKGHLPPEAPYSCTTLLAEVSPLLPSVSHFLSLYRTLVVVIICYVLGCLSYKTVSSGRAGTTSVFAPHLA